MKNLQPNDLLGNRYSIVENLAKGGFGQTYIAEDKGRPGFPRCVVKQLMPESSHPRLLETAQRLFLTEAETLEKLGRHEYIPRLLAYFQEGDDFYLVQEFVNGETLTNEIEVGKPWSEKDIVAMLEAILNILTFIHKNGVIHRDIKPDNIIRRYADKALVLVDFGTVKQFQNQLAVQGQAAPTVAIGTPGYMPTEQGRGNPRQNSDIYALGMVCIQAATGLNLSQLQEDPHTGELIWHHWARLSQPLSAILGKMVYYHFKDRYQSAPKVLEALQTAQLIDKIEFGSDELASPPEAHSENVTQQQAASTQSQGDARRTVTLPKPTVVDPQPPIQRIPQPTEIAPNQLQNSQGVSSQRVSQATSVVSPISAPSSSSKSSPTPGGPLTGIEASVLPIELLKIFKLSAILGTGSWFLVVVLISILGTVLLTTGFWIVIVSALIFGAFAKQSTPVEKILWLAVTIISTGIALIALPENIAISPLLSAGVLSWIAILIVAVLAGAVAFVLLTLAEISAL